MESTTVVGFAEVGKCKMEGKGKVLQSYVHVVNLGITTQLELPASVLAYI